jgi:hypothetical protein
MQCKTPCPLYLDSDRKSGHWQTVMSALPPKADMCSALANVCFGPKADIRHSFDHIASAAEHHGRYREADCFGGLQIYNQFKLGWLNYWQVGGFGAL